MFYRSALDKKKVEEKKTYQAIDYDAPVESDKSTIGFGTRVSISIHIYRLFGRFLIIYITFFVAGWNWHSCCGLWTSFHSWGFPSLWKVTLHLVH
jgi:hypothetical protein